MTEASPGLYAEVCAAGEGMFTAVKAAEGGFLTSIGQDVVIYTAPNEPGPLHQFQRTPVPSSIYDYEWHPSEPAFLLLLRDLPAYFIRAGKVIHTYPVCNHLDEVKSPLAACFDGYDSDYFFTGLGNQVFRYSLETACASSLSLNRPELKVRPKTIISALNSTFNLVAVGTYSKLTYILSLNDKAPVAVLEGQNGGLIQCEFQGSYLYTGGRNDDSVYCWDLRVPSRPLHMMSFFRIHKSQQRVLFTVREHELCVGNGDGSVFIYSTESGQLTSYFMAHFDAVNSVQTYGPHLVTSAGQRHYPVLDDSPPAPLSSIRLWAWEPPVMTSMAAE